jgi:hypothetical protein
VVQEHPGTVIVLGAGASKADDAPLQGELFPEFFRSAELKNRAHQSIQETLARYFFAVWGIQVMGSGEQEGPFPTFEEALGLLDLGYARAEFFKGLSAPDEEGAQQYRIRDDLVSLIALVLREKLRGGPEHHMTLVGRLQESGALASITFASLNYDILIDNAIEAETGALPSYGVDFCANPQWRVVEQAFGKACLYKMHGSLNWLYCPTCGAISLFPRQKVAADLPGEPWRFRCPDCHENLVRLVIPPTFFKMMSNYHLQGVWRKAEGALRECDQIIFCGYSFPDADMHFKYLLKRAEVNRPDGRSLEIYVVNRPPDRTEGDHSNCDERIRYERFFRRKDLVHWTKLSFEQFAEEPGLIEDPNQWL